MTNSTAHKTAHDLLAAAGVSENAINEALTLHSLEIVKLQRTAHDTRRPYFHMGLPCRSEYRCGVTAVIDLADPTKPDAV